MKTKEQEAGLTALALLGAMCAGISLIAIMWLWAFAVVPTERVVPVFIFSVLTLTLCWYKLKGDRP